MSDKPKYVVQAEIPWDGSWVDVSSPYPSKGEATKEKLRREKNIPARQKLRVKAV